MQLKRAVGRRVSESAMSWAREGRSAITAVAADWGREGVAVIQCEGGLRGATPMRKGGSHVEIPAGPRIEAQRSSRPGVAGLNWSLQDHVETNEQRILGAGRAQKVHAGSRLRALRGGGLGNT